MGLDRRLAASVDRVARRLVEYAASTQPNPEVRQRVRAPAESQWREPVVVVCLDDVKPEFDVPGRRKNGTVKGRRLARRFFWNILRGAFGGVANVVLLVGVGGMGNVFGRYGGGDRSGERPGSRARRRGEAGQGSVGGLLALTPRHSRLGPQSRVARGPLARRPCRSEGVGTQRQANPHWPRGSVCFRCYFHHLRNPARCPRCAIVRVLVGRTDTGEDICGPCTGSTVDFTCRVCGRPGRLHADGCCARCVVAHRVHDLYSVLNWLYYHPATVLLADLAAQPIEITHALLDGLPPTRSTRYVRDALIATGALPPRAEHLNRLEAWADRTIDRLPKPQQRIIRPFAEWHVIRDARRRDARNRYTEGAAAADRTDIRTAIVFLDWLDGTTSTLDALTQDQLDHWLDTNPTRRGDLASFLRWASQRRLTNRLELPASKNSLPVHFQTEEQHRRQLRRCLNDDSLPPEVRIIGSLVRLFGLPISRIVELTADRFHRDNGDAFLTISQHPVLLPPKLAALIEEHLAHPCYRSMVRPPAGDPPRYLLPANRPGKPRNARATQKLLRQHGLPTLAARNTAMIEAVGELPPIVIADLFGIHPGTAHAWAKFAQASWIDYLAADTPTDLDRATSTN